MGEGSATPQVLSSGEAGPSTLGSFGPAPTPSITFGLWEQPPLPPCPPLPIPQKPEHLLIGLSGANLNSRCILSPRAASTRDVAGTPSKQTGDSPVP